MSFVQFVQIFAIFTAVAVAQAVDTAPTVASSQLLKKDCPDCCYAAVLSGGAFFGIYELFSVLGLAAAGAQNPVDAFKFHTAWDVVSGISAGSIISTVLGLIPKGKEAEGFGILADFVKEKLSRRRNLRAGNVDSVSPEDFMEVMRSGILDLQTHYSSDADDGRIVVVAATGDWKGTLLENGTWVHNKEFYSGKLTPFVENSTNWRHNITALLDFLPKTYASMAYPGKFPNVTIDGTVYVDGGLSDQRTMMNVRAAVDECSKIIRARSGEMLSDKEVQSKIVLDTFHCFDDHSEQMIAFSQIGMSNPTTDYYQGYVKEVCDDYDNIYWRFNVEPTAYNMKNAWELDIPGYAKNATRDVGRALLRSSSYCKA